VALAKTELFSVVALPRAGLLLGITGEMAETVPAATATATSIRLIRRATMTTIAPATNMEATIAMIHVILRRLRGMHRTIMVAGARLRRCIAETIAGKIPIARGRTTIGLDPHRRAGARSLLCGLVVATTAAVDHLHRRRRSGLRVASSWMVV
jgi:hypothetical protein